MQKAIGFLAMLVLGLCLPSCSSVPTYTININGYTDPSTQVQVGPGGSFFIIENQEAKNPLLEKEIKEKLNKLLLSHGYPVTTVEKADFYLSFTYGIGEPQSVSVTAPDSYGGFGMGFGYGRGYWGGPPGYGGMSWWDYSTYSTTLYDRWLRLTAVEGAAYRTKKISRPVWVGEAHSVGTSSDLRTVLNFLLVADFKEFGKNTGKAVTMEINDQNPEVAALTR